MLSGLTGRRPQFKAVTRGGLLSIGLLLGLGLSACTTVEGTNRASHQAVAIAIAIAVLCKCRGAQEQYEGKGHKFR